jgi:hypothetical protein
VTAAVDRDAGHLPALLLQPLERREDARVLDRGGDEMVSPTLDRAGDRQRVGLRRARREDDLLGIAAQDRGDGLAGILQGAARPAAGGVEARGVPVLAVQEGLHRGADFRADPRRGGVVEVDHFRWRSS